jgi:hypothetical protein
LHDSVLSILLCFHAQSICVECTQRQGRPTAWPCTECRLHIANFAVKCWEGIPGTV